jgi:hypothetical protein
MKFRGLQPDNPILRRELTHQHSIVPRWVWWIELPGIITVVLVAGMFLSQRLLSLPDYSSYTPSFETSQTLLPLVWIIHSIAALRAIMAGAYVTNRDPTKQLWKDLAITGISKWQLIIGKWWAALYRVRGWTTALGIIQLMIVLILILEVDLNNYKTLQRLSHICKHPYSVQSCFQEIGGQMFYFPPTFSHIIWGIEMALCLTILEMLCCTAIGMAAGLAIHNRRAASISGALLRFAPVGIFTFWPHYVDANNFFFWRWREYTWFAFADGGSSAIIRLTALPHYASELGVWFSFYAASGMMIGLLAVSFIAIWVAIKR